MPLNYRVSGDVDVTPAVRNLPIDISPLQNALEYARRRKEAEAQQKEREKAAKAKQAAEEALYNPGVVNDIEYQKELTKRGEQVLDFAAQGYKNGTVGSIDHNYNINKMKQEAMLVKNKADAAIAASKQAYQNIDQLPSYVDKGKLNTQVYDISHPKTQSGDVDLDSIDAKAISDIPVNYYHAINTADMYKEKTKALGEKAYSTEKMFPSYDPNDGTALGQMIRSDSSKAKFFKPVVDQKGKVIGWEPGVTNEAAEFLMNNDPEINGEADYQLQRYITEETAQRVREGDTRDPRVIHNDVEKDLDAKAWKIDHVKMNLERLNESSRQQSFKQGYRFRNPNDGKEEEEFSATKAVNQKRNINLREEGSDKENVQSGDIPEEYRFSGKKLDQPVITNSTKIYDEGSNKAISGQESVGDKKFYPTRAMLMGYNTKTGKYVHGSIESMKKMPDIAFKWVIGGNMETSQTDDDGKKAMKKVFMPYDEVSNDIKAKYGWDLEDRDISEISDLELSSLIKEQYPKSSPEERLKIFKKIRGQ